MFWPQAIEPLSITISQFYEKNPSLTVFTATRIRAGSSEKSFEENLTRRGLQRRLVFKEGENHFFEIQGISDSDTRTYIYKDATVWCLYKNFLLQLASSKIIETIRQMINFGAFIL